MALRIASILAIALVTCAVIACSKSGPWTHVGQLSGGTMEVHFVVIDPQYRGDSTTNLAAADSVCGSDICQVGFFTDISEVPIGRLTSEFFGSGGWKGQHLTALFFRNTNSGIRELKWDCDRYPQPYLNDCLSSPRTPEMLAAARARGPLPGFQAIKFGVSQSTLISQLGGPRHAKVLRNDASDERIVIQAKVNFIGREYDGFFNLVYGKFGAVLLKWQRAIDAAACASEAKKMSEEVESKFGRTDRFGYFDSTERDYEYLWLFGDGSQITIDRFGSYDADCSIALNFSDAAESEGR